MALHIADDDTSVLENQKLFGVNRKLYWANKNDVPLMYEDFPEELRDKMEKVNVAYHGHGNSVSLMQFQKNSKLKEFFKVT